MKIAAFDLSLTQTGYAIQNGGPVEAGVIAPKTKGFARLAQIRNRVIELAEWSNLVVIEGYSFAAVNQAHQLGELGGVIRLELWELRIPFVDVAPSSLKKLATGKGNADKGSVLAEAIRRLGYQGSNNNEADALWLLEAALQHYELSERKLPAASLEALEKVQWPAAKTI